MLKGNNISLKPFEKNHLEKNLEWINDLEFQTSFLNSLPITKTEEVEWYENVVKNKSKVIFSILTDSGKYIGNTGLSEIDHKNRKAAIWIYIGEKNERGKGYAGESIKLLLDYAFHFLNLRKIYLNVAEYNENAIKLYKKMGFVIEGTFKEDIFINEKYCDLIRMALIKQ